MCVCVYVYVFVLPSTLKCFQQTFVCTSRNTCVPHAVPISLSLTCSTKTSVESTNQQLRIMLFSPFPSYKPPLPPNPRPKHSPLCSDVSHTLSPVKGTRKQGYKLLRVPVSVHYITVSLLLHRDAERGTSTPVVLQVSANCPLQMKQ
jgi:hypothetical protein